MPCLKTEGTRTIELLLIVVATACLSCSTVLQSEKDRKGPASRIQIPHPTPCGDLFLFS